MDKPAEMFDRDYEWSALTRFIGDEQPGATLGVVSGRRRQGKTFLLDAACRAEGASISVRPRPLTPSLCAGSARRSPLMSGPPAPTTSHIGPKLSTHSLPSAPSAPCP